MTVSLKQELINIVGAEYVFDSFEDLYCYTYDASFSKTDLKDMPGIVVYPGSTQEVSQLMTLANEKKIPVIPRGAGSNVSGGTTSVGHCIVLVLTRMDKILKLDKENMVAIVEPGVITGKLQQQVQAIGLFYPPDPASLNFSTMGGNVAECAGGPRGVKYGVTRDYVLGLEVVLPTGEIIDTGSSTMKNVTGYNLTQLFTGSEGTLGVITKIIVKLIPLPPAKKTILTVYDSVEKAAKSVSQIMAFGIVPTTLEFLDNVYIRNIEEYAKVGFPMDAEAVLLIEVDGEPEALDKQINAIKNICQEEGAVQVRVAKTPQEAEELWNARRAAFASVARVKPTIIGEDATVPRTEIPAMIKRIREIAAKYQVLIAVVGHAGDGNLHATFLCDERDLEEMERIEKAIEEVFVAALDLNGVLSGEHGIGKLKAKFLEQQVGKQGLQLMKNIKQTLDPNNILNPGVMFGE
ncbi:MAG: FAD-linked oxidase C-terminal domain-containing protein [Bacillota bacterium]|nr:FAD-linked oxidase C-terminal domain-containing protein [Bacillota bacterium]